MAVSLETIDDLLKDTIQNLYAIQSSVHGYLGPETHTELIRKIKTLTTSLHALSLSSPLTPPILLPPEIISYVDSGRNPDIYTREFVELVQRGNAYLRGKSDAIASLRDALAREIVGAWPEMGGYVEGIVGRAVEVEGDDSGGRGDGDGDGGVVVMGEGR